MEIWYVVWLLLSPTGDRASSLHEMQGPFPTVQECVEAGEPLDYPPDAIAAVTPAAPAIVIGCVQVIP